MGTLVKFVIFIITYLLTYLMYLLVAPSEGSIPMISGEEFYVIETDQGDGWTRVRRRANSEEGFVPTTYIRCSTY